MKKERLFELILIIAIMAGAFYAAFSDAHNFPNRWFTRDDAYYYFKVSQNISEGHGSTFDGINLANGYHPLWMLVNIPIFALARFDLVLPLRILLLVMAAIHAASSVLMYRLVSRTLSPLAGSFIALFWAFSIYIHESVVQYGLETGLTVFTLLLFLYQAQKFANLDDPARQLYRQSSLSEYETASAQKNAPRGINREITKLALLAVLVMFSRLDTVFLVLLFGVYLIFRKTYLRYFLLGDIFASVLFGFLTILLRVGVKDYYLYEYPATAYTLTALTLFAGVISYFFSGLYQDPRNYSPLELLKRVAISVFRAQAVVIILVYLSGRLGWIGNVPRSALLLNAALVFVWVLVTRFAIRWLARSAQKEKHSPVQFLQENWSRWFGEGIRYYGIVGAALAAYMLFNKFVFGTPSPVSGQIKRWWGSLSGRVYGGAAREIYHFFGFDRVVESDFSAWGMVTRFVIWLQNTLSLGDKYFWTVYILVGILSLVILLISAKRTTRASVDLGLLPLVVSALIQTLSYHAGGYSAAKEWYWVTHYVLTALLLALLVDSFVRTIKQRFAKAEPLLWTTIFALGIFWGQAYYQHLAHLMPYGVEHDGHPYMDILSVVEDNTEPGALIGMTGGGNLGYFISDRTIVNMDGLINSYDYFLAHKAGYGDDYLAAMGLDYAFANPDILADLPYKGEFVGRLGEPLGNFGNKQLMPFYQQELE